MEIKTNLIGNENNKNEDLLEIAINNKTINDIISGEAKKEKKIEFLKLKPNQKSEELLAAVENFASLYRFEKDDRKESFLLTEHKYPAKYGQLKITTLSNALYAICNYGLNKDDVAETIKYAIEKHIGYNPSYHVVYDRFIDYENLTECVNNELLKKTLKMNFGDSSLMGILHIKSKNKLPGHFIERYKHWAGWGSYDDKSILVNDSIANADPSTKSTLAVALGLSCLGEMKEAAAMIKGVETKCGFDEWDINKKFIKCPEEGVQYGRVVATSLLAINYFIHNRYMEGSELIKSIETLAVKNDKKTDGLLDIELNFVQNKLALALAYMTQEAYK
jgi:hypothetical protein